MSVSQLVFATGIGLMVPLLWAALGETITELSGTINVGVEGVMVLAAFATGYVYQHDGGAVAALLAAIAVGIACGAFLSFLYVRRRADQIVSGILFTAAASALALVLAQQDTTPTTIKSIPRLSVPLLSDIPWIGDVAFNQNALAYAALAAVPCTHYLMQHTWFGLHARAAGERPLVDEVAGVSVRGIRYFALTLGCTLVAVGGGTLVLSTAGTFESGIVNGRGFIALAVVVLARWTPHKAILGALLFGLSQALQFQARGIWGLSALPSDVLLMIPFVLAIFALVAGRHSRYPTAVGEPYRPRAEVGPNSQ